MRRLTVAAVAAAVLTMIGPAGSPASASSEPTSPSGGDGVSLRARAAAPAVGLKASASQVVEGNVLRLTATVKVPKRAKRITLQRWDVPRYYGNPSWKTVKTAKVRRKSTRFSVVASELNDVRYRVVVTRKSGKTLKSKTVGVRIWRWIELRDFGAYYGTIGAEFGQATVNGRSYRAWGPMYKYNARSWESRFTPGRNCKAFRGVVGLMDSSADGSSGTITLTAEDRTVFRSRTLTPGMSQRIQIPLATPYRIGLLAADTSPDGVKGWPVVGEPALLCTNIE